MPLFVVVETIKDELKKHKLADKLSEILVPTHQVTEVKFGKRNFVCQIN